MNEALLHTIWKYKLIGQSIFIGSKNESIEIVTIGEHNQNSGPDFFSSKILIDGVLLVGNVEIHLKTSDWLKHKHQQNKAYDNLILHVVFEHDMELEQNIAYNVSVLELKKYIKPQLLTQYNSIEVSNQKIACGKAITKMPNFEWQLWLERLAITRIETKTEYIDHLFAFSNNSYEDALYLLLCRNFGFKINNDAFELLGKSVSYSVLKKYADNKIQIEALLFGCAGFLNEPYKDAYASKLQNEFEFLNHKHQLIPIKKEAWRFSKTRPVNFPTIRISQLANIIAKQQSLYHLIESKSSIAIFKKYFEIDTSEYWHTHFKFDSLADSSKKVIGTSSFNSIIINTIVPFMVFMAKQTSNESLIEYALELLAQLPAEENTKTKEFTSLGITNSNALQSQAQIQLFDNYCIIKRCLQCNVAKFLLKSV